MKDDNQQQADDGLSDRIYGQLRGLAHQLMLKERGNHTLSPTDLVHEAFVKISKSKLSVNNERHYFCTLARQMRLVLIDHGRYKRNNKNNNGKVALCYTDSLGLVDAEPDFNQINKAIVELIKFDERSAEAIDLVYFANVPQAKSAHFLDISLATLERDLKFGRAFINKYIHDQS